MADIDLIPKPQDVKTPEGELQVMADFAETEAFNILRRWARRYAEKLKNQAFRLNEEDSNFAIKHARYGQQAVGMEILIRFVEGASKELDGMEETNHA